MDTEEILLQRKQELESDYSKFFGRKIIFYIRNGRKQKGRLRSLPLVVYTDFIKAVYNNGFGLKNVERSDRIMYRQLFSYILYSELNYTSTSIARVLNQNPATIRASTYTIRIDIKHNSYRIQPYIDKVRNFLMNHKKLILE